MKKTLIVAAVLSCICSSSYAQYKKMDQTTVCSIRTTSYASIQDAVNAVVKNDTIKVLSDVSITSTIKVAQSTPAFTLDLNGHVLDGSTLPEPKADDQRLSNIIENFSDLSIIDSNPESVHTDSLLASIKGGIITGGKGGYNQFTEEENNEYLIGGAIYSHGNLSITGCTLCNNKAVFGGAIFSDNNTVTITGTNFYDNLAYATGGAIRFLNSNPTLTDCYFDGNMAGTAGAIEDFQDTIVMKDCYFTNNYSKGNGSAIYAIKSHSTITDCLFGGNYTSEEGAASYLLNEGTSNFKNCTFDQNEAGECGACLFFGKSRLEGCHFTKNYSAKGTGALLFYDGDFECVNCDITDNQSMNYGGGIVSFANLTIEDCTITGNTSVCDFPSGGLYIWTESEHPSSLVLKGKVIIKDNTNNGEAANLCLDGNPACVQATIAGLTTGTEIGITTGTDSNVDASKFTTNGTGADAKFFFADSKKYLVNYNKDGYLELVPDPVGIEEVSVSSSDDTSDFKAYDLSGRRLNKVQKGINIIQRGEKTTKLNVR